MIDNFKDLENELRTLTPAPISEALRERLEIARRQVPDKTVKPEARRHIAIRFAWLAAAAVFALSVAVFLLYGEKEKIAGNNNRRPTVTSAVGSSNKPIKDIFKLVSAENYFYGAKEEGVFYERPNRPVQRYRYQFIDTIIWRNEAVGSSIRLTIPREEIILAPVETY